MQKQISCFNCSLNSRTDKVKHRGYGQRHQWSDGCSNQLPSRGPVSVVPQAVTSGSPIVARQTTFKKKHFSPPLSGTCHWSTVACKHKHGYIIHLFLLIFFLRQNTLPMARLSTLLFLRILEIKTLQLTGSKTLALCILMFNGDVSLMGIHVSTSSSSSFLLSERGEMFNISQCVFKACNGPKITHHGWVYCNARICLSVGESACVVVARNTLTHNTSRSLKTVK